jgi:PHD/YefM family antitoxin component YafN of YafNO toxin-antitoxin module
MVTTTFTSRRFNQDSAGAKRAAQEGPVIITDRGEPAFVLMRYVDYRQFTEASIDASALLGSPAGVEDVDFQPPRSRELATAVSFS